MRLIMEKTFQSEDVDVVSVPSGQAAIEKAKELTPDIVIADAGMMGVSGYDVCDAIRNDGSLSGIPVVIMSGISNPYEENRGKSVGATEHIKKPFDTTKLIDRVNELCASSEVNAPPRSSVSGPGVAPARPNLNMPPMAKKDGGEEASSSSTLHAFPRPGLADESVTPVQPVAVNAPPRGADTQPNISTRPSEPPTPEPEPIEIAEEENGSEIQVGTLAELAQMNAQGGTVKQEAREDAIELESGGQGSTDELPLTDEPSRAPAAIHEAASQAARKVASGVEGLTSEQAQAIMALTEDVVEKVVWEVVPDLAEAIIREKLDDLLKS